VDALAAALAPDGIPVALAMTYTRPDAAEAVAHLRRQGVRRLAALPLFPQRSETTTGAGLRELRNAASAAGLHTRELPPYPTLPGFVGPLAAALRQAADQLADAGHAGHTAALLTAHGLPERNVAAGDPYVDHVRQTADAVRAAARVTCPVRLGFQSRLGPVRWVGPPVEKVVDDYAAAGTRALVVVPVTFVCEHLETRYDLDLELRAHAWAAGITEYCRVPVVGDHPELIAGLAAHVRAHLGPGG
jgi:ferrochelatase